MRWRTASVAAIVLAGAGSPLLVAASSAAAATPSTAYVSPTGSGTACSATAPCSLTTALAGPATATILLESGTYTHTGTPSAFTVSHSVTIEPAPGAGVPVLSGGTAHTALTVDAGTSATVTGVTLTHGSDPTGTGGDIANSGQPS